MTVPHCSRTRNRSLLEFLVGISLPMLLAFWGLWTPHLLGESSAPDLALAHHLVDIIVTHHSDGTRCVLVGDGVFPDYEAFTLKDPPRIVLDIRHVNPALASREYPVGSRQLSRIRVGTHPNTVRVVFDIPEELEAIPPYRLERDRERLLVSLGEMAEGNESKGQDDIPQSFARASGAQVAEPSHGGEPMDQKPSDEGLGLMSAVRVTLAKQPFILLQEQQVEISKGVLREASGQFDPTLNSSISHERRSLPFTKAQKAQVGKSHSLTSLTDYRLSLDKQLRSGVILSPNIRVTRTDELNMAFDAANEASLNFTVTIPMFKGRGREATAADEMAAEVELEASRLDLRHTASTSVLNAVDAYWNYLASRKQVDILREAESRARQMVDVVQKLVDGDERPAAEMDQLLANLAAKTAARISADQRLVEARQRLGLTMGLPAEDIDSLPLPSDPFPEPAPLIGLDIQNYRDLALDNRADLLASKKRERSTEILLVAARNNVLPKVDLVMNLGYAGLDEGDKLSNTYGSFYQDTGDLNVSALLNFQYPLGNNQARGLLAQRAAAHQQARIKTADLDRNIPSNVLVTTEALMRSISELRESREAISHYQQAVDNEDLKLLLGMSTLIDVIFLDDRLRTAFLNEVDSEQKYASALARLRFETGTLIRGDEKINSVSMEELTSIPQ